MCSLLVVLAGLAALVLAAPSAEGAVIPAGSRLEVRLSTAAGSRISHTGDPVNATLIAPVQGGNAPLALNGATISGVVESVEPLGLGFKRGFAGIKLHFDYLHLPNGTVLPIDGRVQSVETARERVTSDGAIEGIDAAANLSSGASFFISTLLIHSELAAPAIAVKLLAVRSPDSEIFFPVGTELFVELANDLTIDAAASPGALPSRLSAQDTSRAKHLLEGLPEQQTVIGSKHSSDLVNLLLLGDNDQIHSAFHAAGWTGESRHSVLTLYRMYHCLVQRMGYSMAPMSHLTLNGRRPTSAFQKSLDTFSKRHHVRLWNQPESEEWLGAASEDIGYTIRRMHLTHAIDSEIDNERAKIVNDLWFTGCVQSASLLPRERLRFVGEKGFVIATDGDIAVLRMNGCEHPRTVPKSLGAVGPRSRIAQAFVAALTDVARANPATVAFMAFRSVQASRRAKPPSAAGLMAAARRPSFIDPSTGTARREMVAGSAPGHGYGRSGAASFWSWRSGDVRY